MNCITSIVTYIQSIWGSQESFRYNVIKYVMDCLYASFGTAHSITQSAHGNGDGTNKNSNNHYASSSIGTTLAAAIAASYYAVVGPGAKSAKVLGSNTTTTNSRIGTPTADIATTSSSAYHAYNPSKIMQDSWGLISMPYVKTFSLQASRLLKGAAIAERIHISGVPCFVLSKEPCQGEIDGQIFDADVNMLIAKEKCHTLEM